MAAVVAEARPRPAYVAAAAQASRENDEALAAAPQPHRRADGSTARLASHDVTSSTTSSTSSSAMRWTTGPAAKDLRAAIRFQPAKADASVEPKAKVEGKLEARIENKPEFGRQRAAKQVAQRTSLRFPAG